MRELTAERNERRRKAMDSQWRFVAAALRARPLRVVVVHPRYDLANFACLARRIVGGAPRSRPKRDQVQN
jgi:hypothetical protein